MNRQGAYTEMQRGKKITHRFFSADEFYYLPGFPETERIIAEDGVDHTEIFWSTTENDFRRDGWDIFKKDQS